jgi:hypothetical protein
MIPMPPRREPEADAGAAAFDTRASFLYTPRNSTFILEAGFPGGSA